MRIYFASDLHGSDKCWLKFLAAAKFYEADAIIVGGDLTGKFIVPFVRLPNGEVEVNFLGKTRRLRKEKDIERFRTQIGYSGSYAIDSTPEQYEQYQADPVRLDGLFKRVLLERLERWVELADARLRNQNVRCFVSGGNDDLFEVDDILSRSEVIEVPEGRIVDLWDGIEMFGLGYSNITPWNCPRDIPEEELATKIEALAREVKRMDRAIFDIHVPPYMSGLDSAPKLTENLEVVRSGGGEPALVPVGSTAVRDAILRCQPMLGLHGHIHESKGIHKLGRTTVINPGSEYAEGILRGVLIDIDAHKGLLNTYLVSG